jgi:threonylcarbamoyladenosine tRNA methylthiotransferase CDKAL1
MDKIFIKTYGCSLNVSDSEAIAGILKKAKFKIAETEDEATLVIVNTCIVKEPTESKILKYLIELEKKGKKIVVAGCMPQALPEKLLEFSLIGTGQIRRIVEVVEETMHGNTVVLIARDKMQRLGLPRIRRNKIIEIIPICAGCLGNCSYCIVKLARGELVSYDKKAIVDRAKTAIQEGAKEIWLTAQDTGCYGLDINETLPSLLSALIKIPGDYKIRLGMANPNHVKEYLDELIPILKSDKMYRFLHIPLQSGNDEILKAMHRKYTADDYIEIVKRLRKEMPDLTITTDVICGFPGESDEQFVNTVEVINETKPDALNISRFWKRPHTKAAEMEQVPIDIVRDRSQRMGSVFSWLAFENSKRWLFWQGDILIDEEGKEGTGQWIGRNYAYKQVVLEGNYKIGQKVKVKVMNTTKYDLRAVEVKFEK